MKSTLVTLGLFGLLLGCGQETPRQTETARRAPDAVPVETALVRAGSVRARISAHGTLAARRESHIGAEVSGRIEEVLVQVGDRVEPGDPLFLIDAEPFELAYAQAEAGLDLAEAERRQGQAELARAEELRERDVLAEQALERLRTQLLVAEARERQALQLRDIAARNLANTVARAPFAGSVSERRADEGTVATTQPQTVVVVLQETTTLEARVPVPEARMGRIQRGDPAELYVESLPDAVPARVEAISDSIDEATRTFLVRMRVPNPDHTLLAGAFVRAEIVASPRSDVLVIPRDAIRSEAGEARVFVVRDGRAEPIDVVLGHVAEEDAEVLRGLDAGEQVIVGKALERVSPGDRVRVRAGAEVAAK